MFAVSFLAGVAIFAIMLWTLTAAFLDKETLKDAIPVLIKGLVILVIPIIVLNANNVVLERFNARTLDESIIIKYDNIQFEKSQIDTINDQLSDVVKEYVDHEETVFAKDRDINSIILAGQLYPELKSNELYTSLMDSYQKHNNNLVKGIKDYNDMVGERRKMNAKPLLGRFIPTTDFKTITNNLYK